MRYFLIVALMSASLAAGCATDETSQSSEANHRRFIIQLHNPSQQASQGEQLSQIAGCDLHWLRALGTGAGLWQTSRQCSDSNPLLLKNLQDSPLVKYAEPDKKVSLNTP